MTSKPNAARALRDALRDLIVAHETLNYAQRPCGAKVSTPHAWALLTLLQHQPMTSTDLSARLNIDRTNVSRLCKRMENDGEIERRRHPQDKRATLLSLTERGHVAAHSIDQTSAAHFEMILKRLTQDPSHIEGVLIALVDAMQPSPSNTSR